MTSVAARLDRALRAANIAIVGVSITDEANRATWRVHPPELQAAAQPIIDAFVIPTAAELLDEEAQRETDLRILKAIVIELHAILPAPKPTLAQLRASIIARYKALA